MTAKDEVLAVIPARYGSTRFPGKPLAKIKGRPMIHWVVEAAASAEEIDTVVVATDDRRIYDAVEPTTAEPVMTSSEHSSGSDRVAEVAKKYESAEIILNVQGDEPLIESSVLDRGVRALRDSEAGVATYKAPCPAADVENPDVVKVVCRADGRALYFSRSTIPHQRGCTPEYLQHVGIYLYRRAPLLEFVKTEPSSLERAEELEQLRLLENGHDILTVPLSEATVGVDRPEDIPLVEERL